MDPKTRLDSCDALGMSPLGPDNRWIHFFGALEGGFRGIRASMDKLWLDRADASLEQEISELYVDARMADDPMVLDDYPDEEVVSECIAKGELWVLRDRATDDIVGACAITRDATLTTDEVMIHRGRVSRAHSPGENWYQPGKRYVTLKYLAVRPPYDPLIDVGSLIEYAMRAAASIGFFEIRLMVNLRNKALCYIAGQAGMHPVLLVRRPTNEAYVGFFIRRKPEGEIEDEQLSYRSPEFERLSDEEYAEVLRQMGIEREVFEDARWYRARDEISDSEE